MEMVEIKQWLKNKTAQNYIAVETYEGSKSKN